jgi:anaerobic selenocysteine-containing dehydrogenase
MPLHSKQAKAPVSDIALYTYTNAAAGTPSTGIPPYANRAITDYQLQDGLCVAQINKATAQKLGLGNGQKAMLQTKNGAMLVLVQIYEGIMPDVIAVMAGLGHTEFDRFSVGKGDNILALTQIDMEADSDLPVWLNTVSVVKG